jgi:hypothetical protein
MHGTDLAQGLRRAIERVNQRQLASIDVNRGLSTSVTKRLNRQSGTPTCFGGPLTPTASTVTKPRKRQTRKIEVAEANFSEGRSSPHRATPGRLHAPLAKTLPGQFLLTK